jgi:threonine dehydratase
VGATVFLKAENLQKTGSYKPRGSFNSLMRALAQGLVPDNGIVVDSSGNYGQAVACAAGDLGIPAVIVAPKTTNPLKIAAAQGYGATVITEGVNWSNRTEMGARIAEEQGLLHVPADSWDGIAGDGTLSLELLDQVSDLLSPSAPED